MQINGPQQAIKLGFQSGWTNSFSMPMSFHMASGILFDVGTDIRIETLGAAPAYGVTLSGFIPGTVSAPAISDWGMGIMLLLILAVGGLIFRRTSFGHAAA